MKYLCILMPVYNDPLKVKYTIDHILEACQKYKIDICLCDGCENDNILNLYREYHSDNLLYMDKRKNPTDKLIEAFEELSDKYSYIWLVGDSIVLNMYDIIGYINKYTELGYDIIHFCDENCVGLKTGIIREYTNPIKLYIEDVWYLTCYGATIVSSEFIKDVDWKKNKKKYTDSFYYVMSIVTEASKRRFQAVHIQFEYKKENPYRVANGSVLKGNALQVFGKNWVIANEQLPDLFNGYKDAAIHSLDEHIHFFSPKSVLLHSIYGNFTFDKINKCKLYIPKFTHTPLWYFYVVAIIPKRFLRLLYMIKGRKIA